ncbi:hypothetical protein MtrunA17_Chr2g0304701 [Medicago truncatula]|uniref:Transmembrane protein n=1 Tax=Medicago truncatula TaxID=3880 RepID=A0A072V784_MEDTR|nr:hypothetical protein MTR_2g450420 [Medicago truncatula]RHN73989.1 hypothetical protein MtrunA17_Chr2g0304701 [Medicago truncatula]
MRASFLISLVLLSLLLTKAQGIRLERGSLAARPNKHAKESNLLRRSNSGDEEAILCKDEQCTGKIKNRKLFTTSTSAIHANSKKGSRDVAFNTNVKKVNAGGNEGNTTGNDKANGKEHEIRVKQQQEEDVREELIEISDMDYSPAKRKTPIHN